MRGHSFLDSHLDTNLHFISSHWTCACPPYQHQRLVIRTSMRYMLHHLEVLMHLLCPMDGHLHLHLILLLLYLSLHIMVYRCRHLFDMKLQTTLVLWVGMPKFGSVQFFKDFGEPRTCYDSVFDLILSNLISGYTCWHFYYLRSYHMDTICPQSGYKAQHYYCEVTKQLVRRSNAQYAVDTCR